MKSSTGMASRSWQRGELRRLGGLDNGRGGGRSPQTHNVALDQELVAAVVEIVAALPDRAELGISREHTGERDGFLGFKWQVTHGFGVELDLANISSSFCSWAW